jgi:hypothetical protein
VVTITVKVQPFGGERVVRGFGSIVVRRRAKEGVALSTPSDERSPLEANTFMKLV